MDQLFNIQETTLGKKGGGLQAIYILHCIALHLPKLKLMKIIKICSDSQQCPSKLCLSSIALLNPFLQF